jgi:NADPH:quinone reductase-like Zn-dependent oxidoreductase
MKSVVFDAFGSPGKVLRVEERPVPEPGQGQVRVRMMLSPIHNHDLMIVTGHYGYKPSLPHVPGTEALGVVDKLGEGVSTLKVGQRVTGGASAAWAEYYLASARSLVPLPDGIDDGTACQLVAMPMSAVRLLADLEVKPGDWIVQNAANGAVGKMLARFAAERGINVLNVVRREEAVTELVAEGIGNAVSSEHQDWQDRARALTQGAPVIRAIDSIGGRASDELMDLVAEGGRLVSFGALSGRPLQVTAENLLFKGATISAFWGAKPERKMTPAELGAARADLVRRAAEGKLVLPVAEVFPLERAAEAAEASNSRGRQGKIALRGSAA